MAEELLLITEQNPGIRPLYTLDLSKPPEQRQQQLKDILKRSVGKLTIESKIGGEESPNAHISVGSGFVYKDPKTNEFFIVTAQHCVNRNFRLPEEGRKQYETIQRTISLTNEGGNPEEVELGDALYFAGDTLSNDIAIIRVKKEDFSRFEGREIHLVEDVQLRSDDGKLYIAGYPGGTDELVLMGLDDTSYEQPASISEVVDAIPEQFGKSGGLIFIIHDKRIKAQTVLSGMQLPKPGHPALTFHAPTIGEFQTALTGLLNFAKGR